MAKGDGMKGLKKITQIKIFLPVSTIYLRGQTISTFLEYLNNHDTVELSAVGHTLSKYLAVDWCAIFVHKLKQFKS